MKNRAVIAACGVALVAGSVSRADVVTSWNQVALNAVRTAASPPPPTARGLAMMHTAVYDAVNSISATHRPYSFFQGVAPTTSKDAAAAQAARDTLAHLFPSQAATFNTALASQLSLIPDGPDKSAGIALGSAAASHMIALRTGDGSSASVPYTPGTNPGDWQPTPPAFNGPLFQQYATTTPWTMSSQSQFRQGPPPAIGSAEYRAAYDEVYRLGRATSVERTAEQTDIARLWAAGGGTVTPPGQWNKIAQELAVSQGNTVEENARMFALLNLATADGAIAAWDMKAHYDYWRPVTGITALDDTDPTTPQDATWAPLLNTPAFQAYVSGHSTFSGASSEILASFFGTDALSFSLTADDVAITRSFTSLSGAADEAGQSRIYGGIHWQFDNTAGLSTGRGLADYIFANYLGVPAPGIGGVLALAGLACAGRARRRPTA